MSNEDANRQEAEILEPEKAEHPKPKRSRFGLALGGSALAGALLVGAVAGAVGMKIGRHDERQALLPPVAINAMADDSLVAVKGKVAEQFGNKFVIVDTSGRALVDTGPAGEDRNLVKQDEDVTVQGRFDAGFIRAGMVIHADGKVDELKPPRPHPGPGWGGPDGPRGNGPHDRGPGPERGPGPGGPDGGGPRGPDAPPPPPPAQP